MLDIALQCRTSSAQKWTTSNAVYYPYSSSMVQCGSLWGRSSSLCWKAPLCIVEGLALCVIVPNMVHSYTFLHAARVSRCNCTKTISHNCIPQLLCTSSCAKYPCILKRALPLLENAVLLCGIGLLPCDNGKGEPKTILDVCKVFVPAIVSKCQSMMWGLHAVLVSIS